MTSPKSASDGIAIEKLLPDTRKSENCCASRGEILGAIPAAMIMEAAHRFVETQTNEGVIQWKSKY